jgi:predicted transcriptional regulator
MEARAMPYQLPPDIDQRVQSQIAIGLYQTPAEVLTNALDALDRYNEDIASIQRGIEDERAGRLTPLHEFDREMRERYGLNPHE